MTTTMMSTAEHGATQTISNPNAEKRHIRILKDAAETEGALVEMEARYTPDGHYPPMHFHPYQDEYFTVLQGQVRVRTDAGERRYNAGESFHIPRRTAHTMCAHGETEAVLLWKVFPALQTQRFYETLFGLAVDGKSDAEGKPHLLQMAVMLRHFRDEFVLTQPSALVQRLLFSPLALVGKLFGYRAVYSRYSKLTKQGETTAVAGIWIDRSPAEVFQYVANHANDIHWRHGIVHMSQSPADETRVGTTTSEEIQFMGQTYHTQASVTKMEPGRRLDWASEKANIPVHGWRMVEAEAGGARYTHSLTAKMTGINRLFQPLMIKTMRRQMAHDVERLKQRLETK